MKTVYHHQQSITFRKTKEEFGGLSNMAAGFELSINDISVRTSEAIYQACRFPHLPEIQEKIIEQKSPMAAKMVGKPYRKETRDDWNDVRVDIMGWSIRAKMAQNFIKFGKSFVGFSYALIFFNAASLFEGSKWEKSYQHYDIIEGKVTATERIPKKRTDKDWPDKDWYLNPKKYRIFNFHITQKKILDTLGALLSRTRRPVFFFGRFFTHLTAHVLLGA